MLTNKISFKGGSKLLLLLRGSDFIFEWHFKSKQSQTGISRFIVIHTAKKIKGTQGCNSCWTNLNLNFHVDFGDLLYSNKWQKMKNQIGVGDWSWTISCFSLSTLTISDPFVNFLIKKCICLCYKMS